jgi:hypothetical protein
VTHRKHAPRKDARPESIRKKSVSKASAAKGREDSRAAAIKNEKNQRRIEAKGNLAKLADAYRERAHDVDQKRKVHRREKHKAK